MSIAFICGIPAGEEKNLIQREKDLIQREKKLIRVEKNLHLIQAELNRNPRRNKQIRPAIIDPDNSDGSQPDEVCTPKETKVKKYTKAEQKAGEESFLFFARMQNPAGSDSPPAKRTKKIYNIPSPVSMSESE
jgi:hypothetical protein